MRVKILPIAASIAILALAALGAAKLRGEYRHDFAASQDDLDAFSVHLTFAY
jgi:hypothetical protein